MLETHHDIPFSSNRNMDNQNAGRGRGRGALLLQIAIAQQGSQRGPSTVTTDSGLGQSITKSLPPPLCEITENNQSLRPTTSGRGRLLQDLAKTITTWQTTSLSASSVVTAGPVGYIFSRYIVNSDIYFIE